MVSVELGSGPVEYRGKALQSRSVVFRGSLPDQVDTRLSPSDGLGPGMKQRF